MKTNSLNFEILSDQFVKIDSASDDIAPNRRGRDTLNFERTAELIENFEREKCDLSFVIVFKIEIAIAE